MTFPQQQASAAVQNSQEYWRLQTTLVSPGDIYESDVSSLAFALGPNSDVSRVMISHYDALSSSGVSNAIVSAGCPLVGRIDARADVSYPSGTPRKGRILISVADIYNPDYIPSGFDDTKDEITQLPAVLDLVQWLSPPPTIISKRADKVVTMQYPPETGDPLGDIWIGIPAWGRKSGYFSFFNNDGATTVPVTIIGVRFSTSGDPGSDVPHQATLFTDDLLAQSGTSELYKSSTDGLWDMFYISLGGAAGHYGGNGFAISATLSDDPQ